MDKKARERKLPTSDSAQGGSIEVVQAAPEVAPEPIVISRKRRGVGFRSSTSATPATASVASIVPPAPATFPKRISEPVIAQKASVERVDTKKKLRQRL